jgi:RNA polymerase-binding transcription factor DksA
VHARRTRPTTVVVPTPESERAPESDAVREILLADRERTTRQLEALTSDFDAVVAAASDVATDDEHDPEGATIAYERSRTAALAAQARHHVADIDAALARLDTGHYTVCEECGGVISAARLEALPATRTCIGCAARSR